jgi:hypothetical protein
MKKTILAIGLALINCNSNAEIIFPANDSFASEKLTALSEINDLMGRASAAIPLMESDGILLWANQAAVIPNFDTGVYSQTELPSFTPRSARNEDYLRSLIEDQCECSTDGKEIIGVLIANPYQAAKMYFRAGWSDRSADEVDGFVPPLIIIYHELAHAQDFHRDPHYFSDIASQQDRRWMNKAEESAVMQQNDLALAITAKRGLSIHRRRSYGRNDLYIVDDLFSIIARE